MLAIWRLNRKIAAKQRQITQLLANRVDMADRRYTELLAEIEKLQAERRVIVKTRKENNG